MEVANMENIYNRVQDRCCSDWATLRYDVIGQGEVVGKVYYASRPSSYHWYVVRMRDGNHVMCIREDGKLCVGRVGLGPTDTRLNGEHIGLSNAPKVEHALQVLRSRKTLYLDAVGRPCRKSNEWVEIAD
jgi:hypothetical protein